GATVTSELTAIGSGLPPVISTITANEKGAFSYTLPSDGTWTLSATVTDAASGLTETQGTYVVLDRQADAGGDFAIDATIVNVPGTTNTRVDFVIVGLDPQHIDNAGHVTGGFAVRFTDVNGTSVTSRWGSLSGVEYLNGLADGPIRATATYIDPAGNVATAATDLVLDRVAPVVAFAALPSFIGTAVHTISGVAAASE